MIFRNNTQSYLPSLAVSIVPVAALIAMLVATICVAGADAVQNYSYFLLLGATAVALMVGLPAAPKRWRCIMPGIFKSARQILPAVPILIFIGTLSATWMLSGVVPAMIKVGLQMLSPSMFLFICCLLCACVSVVTGSSWTTIATIGVALMGVGEVMGYHLGWVAGAIISGAYFGDKVSPLSDTTVLAASTCGVPLLSHIKNLMVTSLPAMTIALLVYLAVGMFNIGEMKAEHSQEIIDAIDATFRISPYLMLIPAITIAMIAMRVSTVYTLIAGSIAGMAGIWIFQPQLLPLLSQSGGMLEAMRVMFVYTSVPTSSAVLDPLISTGGIEGMLPTIWLVLSAMLFGGVMIGSGMLSVLTTAITSRLRRSGRLVSATVASGLFLNSTTGDQYLSIIIGGNIYKNTYRRLGLRPQTLSRTLEDSISVTSVLIPWNSCGVTQSTVLGVATLIYMPYCIFNILSPILTIAVAYAGWRIHYHRPIARTIG